MLLLLSGWLRNDRRWPARPNGWELCWGWRPWMGRTRQRWWERSKRGSRRWWSYEQLHAGRRRSTGRQPRDAAGSRGKLPHGQHEQRSYEWSRSRGIQWGYVINNFYTVEGGSKRGRQRSSVNRCKLAMLCVALKFTEMNLLATLLTRCFIVNN